MTGANDGANGDGANGDGANGDGAETGDMGGESTDASVRIRGIYTTALTELLADEGIDVVQASPPIRERFDAALPPAPADATVATTDDRQGIGVVGRRAAVAAVVDAARSVGRDALAWRDPVSRDAVYAGEVTETLGSGAVVELGTGDGMGDETGDGTEDETTDGDGDGLPVATRERSGFLPYSKTDEHIEEGDRLRVQVREVAPPWGDDRPLLDTTIRVQRPLATLVRSGGGASGGGASGGGTGSRSGGPATGGPELADLLPTDPPEGWRVDWGRAADDADLDALGAALEMGRDRALDLEDGVADAADPAERAPDREWAGDATAWVWFGRESRFGLDERRRAVTATMAGHHRTKAATERASAAVDFVEAVCPGASRGADGSGADGSGADASGADGFPFDAVTRQFGPMAGDRVRIDHGKPDGRAFSLGTGEVTRRDPDGTVVVEREMSGRGTYDALGVEQQAGDVAVTKLTEGKWWYPTVYRGDDGEKRGTYVNVCTPVEVFPAAVRYVDLHVDVVKHPDGTVERVDDDELDAAVAAGYLPEALAEKARSVASAVENAL